MPDLVDDSAFDELCAGVDGVVHLAARVHVMAERAADPLAEFRRANVAGTRRLALAARRAGARRFVFLSSVKVHGERSLGRPFTEDDRPAPEDAYGRSKCEAERALAEFARDGGLDHVVLRAPLVYGPGVGANFLALLRLCDTSWPLPLAALTENWRSQIYVGNLVDALRSALTHPNAAGRTYLVRDAEHISTAALAAELRRALGRSPRLFPLPPRLIEWAAAAIGRRAAAVRLTRSLAIDDARIRAELSWHPPYGRAQAIAATVAWYRGLAPLAQ